MKRYIRSSSDDFNSKSVEATIRETLGVPSDIASIIYDWYDAEDAFEDFETLEDFAEYLEDDIYNMIDACDDEELAEEVREAIG